MIYVIFDIPDIFFVSSDLDDGSFVNRKDIVGNEVDVIVNLDIVFGFIRVSFIL
jgi:hypothetical protein